MLETGELEPDLTRLAGRYGLDAAESLIARKRAGERVGLDPGLLETWRPRVDQLFARLDDAHERSALTESPVNEREIKGWLLTVRCESLAR